MRYTVDLENKILTIINIPEGWETKAKKLKLFFKKDGFSVCENYKEPKVDESGLYEQITYVGSGTSRHYNQINITDIKKAMEMFTSTGNMVTNSSTIVTNSDTTETITTKI